ncbi:replication initiation protein RepC [Rhizobium sp. AC44/96]|uniref:plasmid replication protein RepC n=1 Tax=Rhizobium sp. AC44/96 TaxID=1841654 RepID=UPI00080FE132|nr:plasmid replication protein RepC [Rhizobium sp. AC44/96]OCJ08111.1 replication initiation protein RepC [Rhizobium sp. AC44/96]
MERLSVTTPFGRRSMSLALVKRQIEASDIAFGKSVDKWKIHRDACDARSRLGLQDRALAVLNALLSFYPNAELSGDSPMVVFPSNAQLTSRSNGISGSTLRRSLAALVDAGLISRKDSPNGKRYARKGNQGEIQEAYGFSLAPLLARSEELAMLAQEVVAEQRRFKAAKERVSLCRRDIRKLISAAIEEGAAGDWARVEDYYIAIVGRIPRSPTVTDLTEIAEELTLLHDEVVNMLEKQVISQDMTANDGHFDRHKQNSNTESSNELEPSSEKEQEARSLNLDDRPKMKVQAFPLEMVLRACRDIRDYGPEGDIKNWRDLMMAAVTVRSMLGVSPSAYEEACEVMGQATAASVMACIFEKSGHINSPGGYLRDLTGRARRGEFSLGPMIMALMRGHGSSAQVA